MIQLATKMMTLKPSSSMAIADRARQLRQEGAPIIDLSTGEPDFATPANICDAGVAAIQSGITRYNSVAGMKELRQAICEKLSRENNLRYSIDQVSVGCGAKQVVYNTLAATLREGDEVIIPCPYWTSYPEIVRLAGGKPVFVACPPASGFKVQPADLAAAVTSKSRWLILNSPNNPTGAVYSKTELLSIASVLASVPDLGVISDDIYEHIVFGQAKFQSIAALAPSLYDRTVVVNGVSKAYAMTGWRVGYGAGPTDLIKALNTIQSHTTTHTSTISQIAATEALSGDQTTRDSYVSTYSRRARTTVELINSVNGLQCAHPDGTFYCYVSCAELIGKRFDSRTLATDIDIAEYLLEAAQVAVVPGAAYGLSPFFRISFATSTSEIETAVQRIAEAITQLR